MPNQPTPSRPFRLVGELMNNSFARARRAWKARDPQAYQKLAKLQEELGADCLTLNLDGTQQLQVQPEDMISFLPELVPAIQEVTALPIAFDSPDVAYHRQALKFYDAKRSGRPLFNSLSASRTDLPEMLELIAQYDTRVIVMASEKFADHGAAQCANAEDVHEVTKHFVELLRTQAGRSNDQIIVDPGLAPVAADTFGLVNMGLDAMRLIRQDPDLEGIHLSVGLTNFSFGTPKKIRENLENAYLTLGVDAGLDFVLGNPEKQLNLLDSDHRTLQIVSDALELGRPKDEETQEDAGINQASKIMELFR